MALVAVCSLTACGGATTTQSTTGPYSGAEGGPSRGGSEKEIEEFGAKANGSERRAILASEQRFFGSLAERDYEATCTRLSHSFRLSLERTAVPALRRKGCPAVLAKLLSPAAPILSREAAEGQVIKVRVKGEQAFLVYRAPGAKLWVLPMVEEGGKWRATSLQGSVLVPNL